VHAARRVQAGGAWTWRKLSAAPWKRVGLWAGGAFGVLALALVLFATFADWNALKGPVARMASAASGREIVIRGDLDVDPWSWTPKIHVSRLHVGNPPRYRDRGSFAEIAKVDAAVRLLPLFVGRLEVVSLDLRGADLRLYRGADGVSNWANATRERPVNLPAIRRFALRQGRVRLQDDKRHMLLDAMFTTEESVDRRHPGRFALTGEGRINSRPFTLELTGAPLLNVRRDRPYPFFADVHAGGTRIVADGAIRRPFDFGNWEAAIDASGPDLADLYELTGITLPNTPPYSLAGVLQRRGLRTSMPHVAGRVGDSDLAGAFAATRRSDGRLFFDGDFRTRSLDFDDLMAVLGGPPDTHETASAEQRAMAANLQAQGRLLPDARLDISRVRNMDARVSYRAARVRSQRFPLRGLSVDVGLDHGLLRLDPMTLDLNRGRIGGAVSLNARQSVPHVNLDVRLSRARLESIFTRENRTALSGELLGRAQLSGAGASVRQAAANANGTVTLVTPRGEIREALAELTGINVTRGLGLLLAKDDSTIPIRCGIASFAVRNGVARVRNMTFDTETMLIHGRGAIDLRDETFDLRIRGEPKEVRLIRVGAPITVRGRLRAPRVGVELEEAADQGGIAALLGSLVAPIAALLPFVDSGLAEDQNCAALLAGREQPHREG
jgi:uncharacterized protein involved in outer membrane biogenesis